MAVSTAQGQVKREFDTESNNRAENIVAFARESLKLLIDVMLSRAESPSL